MSYEKLGRVLEGEQEIRETGVECPRAADMARTIKFQLQHPQPGIAPLQAPTGLPGDMKAFFLLMIEDLDFWKSVEVARHFQLREPVRTYGVFEYATAFLGISKKQKN